jgi:hypothetical protein
LAGLTNLRVILLPIPENEKGTDLPDRSNNSMLCKLSVSSDSILKIPFGAGLGKTFTELGTANEVELLVKPILLTLFWSKKTPLSKMPSITSATTILK